MIEKRDILPDGHHKLPPFVRPYLCCLIRTIVSRLGAVNDVEVLESSAEADKIEVISDKRRHDTAKRTSTERLAHREEHFHIKENLENTKIIHITCKAYKLKFIP